MTMPDWPRSHGVPYDPKRERVVPSTGDRPCNEHPPPSTLAGVHCRVCGAFRTGRESLVFYVERIRR